MVREAGGRTSDFLGAGGLDKGAPILCANPALYGALESAMGAA
jgi:hypothetical protein